MKTITEQLIQAEQNRLAEAEKSHKIALAIFGVLKNLTVFKNGEVK